MSLLSIQEVGIELSALGQPPPSPTMPPPGARPSLSVDCEAFIEALLVHSATHPWGCYFNREVEVVRGCPSLLPWGQGLSSQAISQSVFHFIPDRQKGDAQQLSEISAL